MAASSFWSGITPASLSLLVLMMIMKRMVISACSGRGAWVVSTFPGCPLKDEPARWLSTARAKIFGFRAKSVSSGAFGLLGQLGRQLLGVERDGLTLGQRERLG